MFLEQEVLALEQVDFRFRHVATVSLAPSVKNGSFLPHITSMGGCRLRR
jgi:hypothetical protein